MKSKKDNNTERYTVRQNELLKINLLNDQNCKILNCKILIYKNIESSIDSMKEVLLVQTCTVT